MVAVVPARVHRTEPREYDTRVYRARHGVECFIGKIKHCRRICSRFDQRARRYLGFLHCAAALIRLRGKVNTT